MLEDMVEDTKLKYVQLLLMKRADPNTADRDSGNTVLHYCALNGDMTVAEVALDAKASVETPNNLGRTPLHQACYSDRPEMVKRLLGGGRNGAWADTCGAKG